MRYMHEIHTCPLLCVCLQEQLEEYCRSSLYEESGTNLGDGFNTGRTTRSVFVRVDGVAFAHFDSSPIFRVGLTASETTRWTSDSALSMRAPRGGDQQLPIFLTVTHQVGTSTCALTYDKQEPRQSKPPFHPPYSPPSLEQARVTLLGKSYASVDMSVAIYLGHTRCVQTRWRSDSSIDCRVSDGVGVGLPVSLSLVRRSLMNTHLRTNTCSLTLSHTHAPTSTPTRGPAGDSSRDFACGKCDGNNGNAEASHGTHQQLVKCHFGHQPRHGVALARARARAH